MAPLVDRDCHRAAALRKPGCIGKHVALQMLCQGRVVDAYRSENCRTVCATVPYRGYLEFCGVVGGDADPVPALDPHPDAASVVMSMRSSPCNSSVGALYDTELCLRWVFCTSFATYRVTV